ncbi:hypothetical protein [Roseomonas chloroacetimidivorans]|uniref:hypothetical protein n=1 Tax=Roseomonas chloroacetimidivorans TaxID=1766656 RepID=UPI003C73CDC4
MTPTRLRECIALLRWSQRGLADALGIDEARVRKWARGVGEVPEDIAAWLERRAEAMASDPPPSRRAAEAA